MKRIGKYLRPYLAKAHDSALLAVEIVDVARVQREGKPAVNEHLCNVGHRDSVNR